MTIDKQVERLRVEPHETDSDHVMFEKQITEALKDAYIRGAEAMREACAARIGSDPALLMSLRSHCESALRALPIPEEP